MDTSRGVGGSHVYEAGGHYSSSPVEVEIAQACLLRCLTQPRRGPIHDDQVNILLARQELLQPRWIGHREAGRVQFDRHIALSQADDSVLIVDEIDGQLDVSIERWWTLRETPENRALPRRTHLPNKAKIADLGKKPPWNRRADVRGGPLHTPTRRVD